MWSESSDISDNHDQDTTISNVPPRIAKEPDEESDESATVEAKEEEKESNKNLEVNDDDNNEISDESDEKENAKKNREICTKMAKESSTNQNMFFSGGRIHHPSR